MAQGLRDTKKVLSHKISQIPTDCLPEVGQGKDFVLFLNAEFENP